MAYFSRLPRLLPASLVLTTLFCLPAIAQDVPKPPVQPAAPPTAEPEKVTGVAQIRRDAVTLQPLFHQEVTRDFLKATADLPGVKPRSLMRDPMTRKLYGPVQAEKLDEETRKRLVSVTVDESFYYNTRYGSPLAYARALEVLGEAGLKSVEGKRLLDFGYGTVGHLRLLARCGANAVGVDVDPVLSALYADPTDQGPVPGSGKKAGSIQLVDGQFPATPAVTKAVGGEYDLILSKNTLKNGYLHPSQPVNKALLVDLGVDEPAFVRALFDALKPGGKVLIYNLSPAPSKQGEPYKPWADGKCPFPVALWESTGFKVLAFDKNDDTAAREMGKALGWNQGPGAMDLQNDLFAQYTLVEKPL